MKGDERSQARSWTSALFLAIISYPLALYTYLAGAVMAGEKCEGIEPVSEMNKSF